MNQNDDHNAKDWLCKDYCLEDNFNTNMTTPVQAFGDHELSYHVTNNGKEVENHYNESSSQVKRRRMLQFDDETLDAPICSDDMLLRSEETLDSLEDAIADMSNWVAGFAEDTPAPNSECVDPSVEGWISDCFNDPEMQLISEDCENGASAEVQLDITEACETFTQHKAKSATKLPVRTNQNVVLRGKKSYMRTPSKLASSIVYPFTFIKPCEAHGDMTLKDINKKILTPPKPKADEQDLSGSIQTSAFSGKPVVGKTKIRTEGGEGSITILRTKG